MRQWRGSWRIWPARRWLHGDRLGSIAAWTNSSGGSPTINKYDEYGLPAATNSGRFQYTGQAWIGELGLYYYKARFYSPGLGRFMQTDPVGYEDQVNLYAYVGNDPVNGVDPDGTTCIASRIDVTSGSICQGSAITTIEVSGGRSSGGQPQRVFATVKIQAGQPDSRTSNEAAYNFFLGNEEKYQRAAAHDQEIAGVILKMPSGVFKHTESVTVPQEFMLTLRIYDRQGGTVSAFAHSHNFRQGEGFSGRDIRTARGTPFYLRTPSGGVRFMSSRAARFADEGDVGLNACPLLTGHQGDYCLPRQRR